eukprot:CAMPEP_0184092838 /NCGR_PEP_ID=MMETSP0974-20121125/8451_1 /TAXON_ID=483370 /ORGANISM="non described non described, Strain CCMP2097" /LENGTH=67 /DNA_ID=CAMNT_0026395603 /DNA_START=105 /DNA_END=305 /DNA_ORIENTATION=+
MRGQESPCHSGWPVLLHRDLREDGAEASVLATLGRVGRPRVAREQEDEPLPAGLAAPQVSRQKIDVR